MTDQQQVTVTEFNRRIIAEFRANGGRVGGPFEGAPIVLLTTAGAKSGRPRTNPAIYFREDARILVFASNAGASTNPDWFHNLLADPHVTVEIGENDAVVTYSTRAVPLEGDERDRAYAAQAERDPAFADYAAGTSRTIPAVALYPYDVDADHERNKAIGEQLIRHHNELRAELRRVRDEAVAYSPDGSAAEPGPGHQLFGHCLTFCDHLRLHHIREDGAFTAFERRFPGLVAAIDRLRREHEAVAQSVAELQARLDRPVGASELVAYRADLDRLATDIEEHFGYEEEQLLPALGISTP